MFYSYFLPFYSITLFHIDLTLLVLFINPLLDLYYNTYFPFYDLITIISLLLLDYLLFMSFSLFQCLINHYLIHYLLINSNSSFYIPFLLNYFFIYSLLFFNSIINLNEILIAYDSCNSIIHIHFFSLFFISLILLSLCLII